MKILLKDILHINDLHDYKIHFGRNNTSIEGDDGEEPLDAWVKESSNWEKWQQYHPGRNEFNRKYIFSLMRFYHEEDTWFFGGVFKVLRIHTIRKYKDKKKKDKKRYEVELTNIGEKFIGRLKIDYSYRIRTTRPCMENHYDNFEVKEILPESYTGRFFPGYEKIDISFGELESLIKKGRSDWKTALENAKGIYLLTDTKTNKKYVGSASGKYGVWGRWRDYTRTDGHAGNKGIQTLIKKGKIDYCRKHFRFSLLENKLPSTSKDEIISRETYWKKILRTRKGKDLNRN